jgi:hexosaminidase
MRIHSILCLLWLSTCNLPMSNKYNNAEITPTLTIAQADNVATDAAATAPAEPITIIPQPVKVEQHEGFFLLNNKTNIILPNTDPEWQKAAALLQRKVRNAAGFDIPISTENNKKQLIVFQQDSEIKSSEAYSLDVNKYQITIKAAAAQGAFYGVQSLLQLLPDEIESLNVVPELNLSVPCCNIWDEPRFAWRGMHLDVSRHFYNVSFVKKYIDLLAMHKFNRFHWHLTDDQGWRIEIKKYPKLTEVGGYRNGTIKGKPKGIQEYYDGQKYGGYYTQEQIKDIVQYAAERFVTIIPEIEMPGHCTAALAAYPSLACEPIEVETQMKWGGFPYAFCPKQETFVFLEDVLTEIIALFPSQYIHIGGDEVNKTPWEESEFCQNLMKEKHLDSEDELQSYFIRHIEQYLNQKGKKLIGWDEILEGGLSENATVMAWRGEEGAIEAAKQHHDAIMSPENYCYFNFYQHADKESEPLAMGKTLSVKKVYSFDPVPDDLMPEQAKHIIGAQGNVWTEYMRIEKDVEYMVFPRALALAEVVWTPQDKRVWTEFRPRLLSHLPRLDVVGVNYAKHVLNNK